MKKLFVLILLLCPYLLIGQEIKNLYPNEVTILSFDGELGKKWAERDEIFKQLDNAEIEWADLSKQQTELIDELGGEMITSMWQSVGDGCSWYCGGGPRKIKASSYLKSQGKNNYSPQNAHDFSYKTAWVEGVEGYGLGESLTYEFSNVSPRINQIHIVNGYVKNKPSYERNSRVKKLKMYVFGKPFAILNLKDVISKQSFKIEPLGHPERKVKGEQKLDDGWEIKFEILEVYKGTKYDDVVISEIYFDGLDVHCLGKGTEITMANGAFKPIENIAVGDEILTYNQLENVFESSIVEELASPYHTHMTILNFSDGSSITATPDHPFMVGPTWKSLDPNKTMASYKIDQVEKIEQGDRFMGSGKNKILKSIRYAHSRQKTYTIVRLSKNNNFIANGIVTGIEELKSQRKEKTSKSISK